MRVAIKWVLAVFVSVFCASFVFAQDIDDLFKSENENERVWSEIEVLLPAFPKPENLVPFRVGAVEDKKFFIDMASFSVGKDEVLRYTLVIESASGAKTISYEGMRCETSERRVYAFGHATDQRWSPPRKSAWAPVPPGANVYAELAGTYFCPIGGASIFSAEDAKRALQRR